MIYHFELLVYLILSMIVASSKGICRPTLVGRWIFDCLFPEELQQRTGVLVRSRQVRSLVVGQTIVYHFTVLSLPLPGLHG